MDTGRRGRHYSAVELDGNPDFVRLAEAYGLRARRADDAGQLDEALLTARDADHSTLIHVPVERESNIMPMLPPGGGLKDFFGFCMRRPGEFFSPDELAAADTDSAGGGS